MSRQSVFRYSLGSIFVACSIFGIIFRACVYVDPGMRSMELMLTGDTRLRLVEIEIWNSHSRVICRNETALDYVQKRLVRAERHAFYTNRNVRLRFSNDEVFTSELAAIPNAWTFMFPLDGRREPERATRMIHFDGLAPNQFIRMQEYLIATESPQEPTELIIE